MAQPDWLGGPPGRRHVLALDGGGVRGMVTLRMLEAFEQHFGVAASDAFDFFAGTSTGAIIAALLAFRRLPAGEILGCTATSSDASSSRASGARASAASLRP